MAIATTNEWYVFGGGSMDKKTCNKIRRWAAKDGWNPAVVDITTSVTDEERISGRVPDYKPDSKLRVSDVAWCNDKWIYDIIFPYMEQANQEASWKYDIKAAESAQITRYKKGGFYNFHTDGSGDHLVAYDNPDNPAMHGHVRKLSMTVILNDNFEGGALEFAGYAKEKCTITPVEAEAGSVIVFPSCMEHRVTPITKGTRYSVVCWFLGPPFV